ncbi:hypothetical protein [Silvimonas iriomotensis]|uniref:Uncharacterized protein n=1 Tax=Silvimonas iriomotensis TaxID=449662 RepID=A0ABQ2P960_9NEIS|nr:hypothetical protein [Silvimonas iriomotensis]GGP21095.1 hypothetical protein GCM10010970_18760 [Silvimonas iriomotensis]
MTKWLFCSGFSATLLLLGLSLGQHSTAGDEPVVFEDSFANPLDARWTGNKAASHGGKVVADPLGAGKVLTFKKPVFGGDMFSARAIAAGHYHLSVDYLVTHCPDVRCGGVVGLVGDDGKELMWLFGPFNVQKTDDYPGVTFGQEVPAPAQWTALDADFTSPQPFHLVLEHWNADGAREGQVYYRNLKLVQRL